MSKQYKYKAIPTLFNKTLYRSRLEARWAVFFTSIGWSFTYEPLDMEGWSPDFKITTHAGTSFFVEVKPSTIADIDLRIKLGRASNFSEGILLLNESPFSDKIIPNVIGMTSVKGQIKNSKDQEDFEFCTSVIFNQYGAGLDIINLCERTDIDLGNLSSAENFTSKMWNEAGEVVKFLKPKNT